VGTAYDDADRRRAFPDSGSDCRTPRSRSGKPSGVGGHGQAGRDHAQVTHYGSRAAPRWLSCMGLIRPRLARPAPVRGFQQGQRGGPVQSEAGGSRDRASWPNWNGEVRSGRSRGDLPGLGGGFLFAGEPAAFRGDSRFPGSGRVRERLRAGNQHARFADCQAKVSWVDVPAAVVWSKGREVGQAGKMNGRSNCSSRCRWQQQAPRSSRRRAAAVPPAIAKEIPGLLRHRTCPSSAGSEIQRARSRRVHMGAATANTK